jgi:hypothetical protein
MPLITDAPPHPAGRRRSAERAIGPALQLGTLILCLMVLVLPLMMGHRTPETLTASLMVMTVLALAAAALTSRDLPAVPAAWMWIAGAMSVLVVVQVWPSTTLARLFGPYPDELWQHPTFSPAHWSPDPGATLRGWAAFIALLAVAWMGRSLPGSLRHWVWLAIVAMALFQGLYGLLSHAAGAQSIFGIWERNNPGFVHGSFSNRNLYAAYLAPDLAAGGGHLVRAWRAGDFAFAGGTAHCRQRDLRGHHRRGHARQRLQAGLGRGRVRHCRGADHVGPAPAHYSRRLGLAGVLRRRGRPGCSDLVRADPAGRASAGHHRRGNAPGSLRHHDLGVSQAVVAARRRPGWIRSRIQTLPARPRHRLAGLRPTTTCSSG